METDAIFNQTWLSFIGRYLLNLICAVIIARIFYYAKGRGTREYMFTYITVSTVIFIVCILISNVKVELGLALGLLAVFSVIRFRSVQATARELSYLFICMGVALVFALLPSDTPFIRVIVNSILILATIGLAEYFILRTRKIEKVISYDRHELLSPERRGELELDLRDRFGITGIQSIQAGNIDVLKGKTKLKITFRDGGNRHFPDN